MSIVIMGFTVMKFGVGGWVASWRRPANPSARPARPPARPAGLIGPGSPGEAEFHPGDRPRRSPTPPGPPGRGRHRVRGRDTPFAPIGHPQARLGMTKEVCSVVGRMDDEGTTTGGVRTC